MTRKSLLAGWATAAAMLLGVALTATIGRTQDNAGAAPPGTPTMTAEEFDKMFKETSNWGRWGKDDRLGAMNLITDAKRKQAAALVKLGVNVSMTHTLSTEKAPDNPSPFELKMAASHRVDTWSIAYHGTFVTHFDSLCHFAYEDKLYNGIPVSESTETGCANGVEHFKNGIITRGILIDIPRLKGVPYLEPGTTVSIAEVEAWEKKAGVKVSAGDAVILRTGRWARREKLGPWKVMGDAAGFHPTVARWIKARDVALVGGDTTAEAQNTPSVIQGVPLMLGLQPLHTVLIAGMGVPLIDDVDPEVLAETCARLNRWEFMFFVAPLPVPGGTGGPVNAVAMF